MAEPDPNGAAQDLAEVDRRLRRGAELTMKRSRWSYPAIWLAFALWGANFDLPPLWRWLGMLGPIVAILVVARSSRAEPLPVRVGWRTWLIRLTVLSAAVAGTYGLGLALRGLAVPLPFTISGFVLGVAATLAGQIRRLKSSYVERVSRGQW